MRGHDSVVVCRCWCICSNNNARGTNSPNKSSGTAKSSIQVLSCQQQCMYGCIILRAPFVHAEYMILTKFTSSIRCSGFVKQNHFPSQTCSSSKLNVCEMMQIVPNISQGSLPLLSYTQDKTEKSPRRRPRCIMVASAVHNCGTITWGDTT